MESINVVGSGCACRGSGGGGPQRREPRPDHGTRKPTNPFIDGPRRTAGAPARSAPLLSAHGLRHRLAGEAVLDNVGFDLRPGEALGLTGPGAPSDTLGRTALVRMVSGLMPADPGVVLLDNRPLAGPEADPLHDPVSYVAHSAVVTPTFTVAETLRLWARMRGLPGSFRSERHPYAERSSPAERRADLRELVAEALTGAGIEQYAGTPVNRCSPTVLRELSLAVAMLRRPRLLVFDEPTRGLDARGRDRLLETVGRVREGGVAVLYAGRDESEVRQVCRRVGVLDRGRLEVEGRAEERPQLVNAAA
ncbi:ATP-binding cassette domain-containing protein [Dactylosporangium sp. CA-139066]|uniref:ATP-binding cassette domain-containing protein n=1 Tax=Dactylosporangium sp. CA-139066 TaxID=3239930 RepID=UPI003D8CABB0